MRLLFLALLILAFAQPIFNKNKKNTANRLQLVYIDNSYSMTVKKGARTLLDIAKEAALLHIRQGATGIKYILLTNDKPASYQPLPADKVASLISNLEASPATKTASQLLGTAQGIMQNEGSPAADLYYYSDFQRNSFAQPDAVLLRGIDFYGVPVQAAEVQNVYIDTAYLTTPVLQAGQTNQVVVRTRAAGAQPKEMPVLQLTINGQVKAPQRLPLMIKMKAQTPWASR